MSKQFASALLVTILMGFVTTALAQTITPCPGYNPANNTNLACEIATATRASGKSSLGPLPATFAAQLSSLPVATAVSGTGITFVNGIPTFSSESLGTILTQRGDTIGRHRYFVSFDYQRFGFGSVDGVRFKDFNTVNQVNFSGVGTSYTQSRNSINMTVDQFTTLGTYGLTSRLDLTLIVPFSTVNLGTVSSATQFNTNTSGNLLSQFSLGTNNLFGSKTGPGDVTISVKGNLFKSSSEKTSIAVGSELRIPTGDETNYLGTGAYGVKPYFIISHRGKRLTPNANIGYQWNSTSSLYTDPNTGTHLNLPGSLLYTGGLDYRVTQRFTMVGEFLGQFVINGPRITTTQVAIGSTGQSFSSISVQGANGQTLTSNYSVDNAGFGFKLNPFGGLLVSASAYFKLDDNGLRAKWVPLVGVSYRF